MFDIEIIMNKVLMDYLGKFHPPSLENIQIT